MVLHKVTGSPVKWSQVIDVKAELRCILKLQQNSMSEYAIQSGSFRSDYYIGFTGFRSSGRVSRSSIQGSNSPHGHVRDARCCYQSFGIEKCYGLFLIHESPVARTCRFQEHGSTTGVGNVLSVGKNRVCPCSGPRRINASRFICF